MVPLAPRYDPRIVELARALDDAALPVAETVRRVGTGAELLGLYRPSYSHLRRFVVAERERQEVERLRREAVRQVVRDAALAALAGRALPHDLVLDRLEEAERIRGP